MASPRSVLFKIRRQASPDDQPHWEQFELPWHPPALTHKAIRAAWENDGVEDQPKLPIALYPMHIHPRLQVQKGCFTIQGRRKESLCVLVAEAGIQYCLAAIDIDPSCQQSLLKELRILGVSHSTLFPDLDGLAKDLKSVFWGLEGLK